jgi:hypothetical protein
VLTFLLLLGALICFGLAAFSVAARINLIAAGLFLVTLDLVIKAWPG